MSCLSIFSKIQQDWWRIALTHFLDSIIHYYYYYYGFATGISFTHTFHVTKLYVSPYPGSNLLNIHTHTHPFNGLFPGIPRWAGTRKVKPIWILLKQETVSGSGISWAVCKSAPRSRQITTPAPHHSVFYRPDALPAAQPTASKHWRQKYIYP